MFKFLQVPAKRLEQTIVNFGSRVQSNPLEQILVGSDQDIGGFSTAHVDLVESEHEGPNDPRSFGRFHGNLNLDLPPARPDVVQSGYAMFRTKEIESGWFGLGGSEFLDWESCTHMLLKVRGDRRKYFVNLQAESAFPTDIYQHRLFLRNPGNWETVIVPLHDFILTNYGVIQQQSPLDLRYIKTVGIGLIDKQYGPFSLDIDWIKVVGGDVLSKLVKEGDKRQANNTGKLPVTPGKRLSIND
jgi:NADH dehydrogenase [ubiquinone] 1 alpha subcomplex assembly factor 1